MAQKSIYRLISLLIIVLAVFLAGATIKQVQFVSGADEGYYFNYASFIAAKGVSGLSGFFKGYLQNTEAWLFPNPLRVGFIALSGAWLKIFGSSMMNMAYLSLFCYFLFLLVSYYFAGKYLKAHLRVLFIALLAFSPIQMAMGRRALMDSAVNLFSVLSIWLFWDFWKRKKRLGLVLFVVASAFNILVKETGALLNFAFLAFLAVNKFIYKEKTGLRDFASVLIFPPLLAGLAFFALGCAGFLAPVAGIILSSPANNHYAINFGSGPWFRYLIDFMLLSPWTIILAIGFIFYLFLTRQENKFAVYLSFFSLAMLILLNMFTKNVRYAMVLDMPIRLFALLMLEQISNMALKRHAAALLSVLVILIALFDYLNFYSLFVSGNIYDPVTFSLLQAKQIIPFE